jgi:hypothetical protein
VTFWASTFQCRAGAGSWTHSAVPRNATWSMPDGSQPWMRGQRLATTVIRAPREAGVDSQAPLRMLARTCPRDLPFRRCPLDLPPILLSSARFLGIVVSGSEIGATFTNKRACSSVSRPKCRAPGLGHPGVPGLLRPGIEYLRRRAGGQAQAAQAQVGV